MPFKEMKTSSLNIYHSHGYIFRGRKQVLEKGLESLWCRFFSSAAEPHHFAAQALSPTLQYGMPAFLNKKELTINKKVGTIFLLIFKIEIALI
jgi:hypothetical protein